MQIIDSARKRGFADEDMLHAVRNVIRTEEQDDDLTMFIGPARDNTMLEVGQSICQRSDQADRTHQSEGSEVS